jgi:hypothetical protein
MRRFAVPSAIARSACLSALLLTTACAGRGLTFATTTRPNDPNLLLSCARTVAADQGLGVVTQSSEQFELQAKSAVEAASEPSAAAPQGDQTYDVLTVKLSPAKRGFEMLVGSASYVLRSLRPAGADAAKNEWVGTSPSSRVALARDAVLTQCGNLGN